ncbi:DUF397 domain-containing protein [Streptomyces sp. NPDC002855]|uniref:DUF397 domain-containing protein n=1 Tax=Streptomyces sp. NPDC002855 TaxID=3154437 RepID=UPI0033173CCC
MPQLDWQKSTFSEDQANCLYIATAPDGTIRLRESDTPETILTTGLGTLAALLNALSEEG